jgi:hypothetical protein
MREWNNANLASHWRVTLFTLAKLGNFREAIRDSDPEV